MRTTREVWAASPVLSILYIVLAVVQALSPAGALWVSKELLDTIAIGLNQESAGSQPQHVMFLLCIQIALLAVGALSSVIQSAVQDVLGPRIEEAFTIRLLNKAATLSLEEYETPEIHDALRLAHAEVSGRAFQVWLQILSIGQSLLALLSISGMLAILGIELLPLIILATLPGVLTNQVFGIRSLQLTLNQTARMRVQAYLGAMLTTDRFSKEVRVFNFAPYVVGRWSKLQKVFQSELVDLVKHRGLWLSVSACLSAVLMGIASWIVVQRALSGTITLGEFSVFTAGAFQVQARLSTLLNGGTEIVQSLQYIRHLFAFLDQPHFDSGRQKWTEDIRSIEFRNVSFRYPNQTSDTVTRISFTITKGESLAMIGANGAGKSTIIKLLLGLYAPSSGLILINEKDASDYDVYSLQRQMSVAFQDFSQYHTNVLENIILSETTARHDGERIEEAVGGAGADFIKQLPQGLGQQLGSVFDSGVQLSGGQWQRLAVSRSLFRQSRVMIFDEPAASLDPEAEFELMNRLRCRLPDQLSFIVSHRFSSIRFATRIIRLEQGQIAEMGSHNELLKADGEYARLFRLQASSYQDAEPFVVI